MKCFKCGNGIEDNLECPFCGYINKEEAKRNIKVNAKKIRNYSNEKKNLEYKNYKPVNPVISTNCFLKQDTSKKPESGYFCI